MRRAVLKKPISVGICVPAVPLVAVTVTDDGGAFVVEDLPVIAIQTTLVVDEEGNDESECDYLVCLPEVDDHRPVPVRFALADNMAGGVVYAGDEKAKRHLVERLTDDLKRQRKPRP